MSVYVYIYIYLYTYIRSRENSSGAPTAVPVAAVGAWSICKHWGAELGFWLFVNANHSMNPARSAVEISCFVLRSVEHSHVAPKVHKASSVMLVTLVVHSVNCPHASSNSISREVEHPVPPPFQNSQGREKTPPCRASLRGCRWRRGLQEPPRQAGKESEDSRASAVLQSALGPLRMHRRPKNPTCITVIS